MENVTRRLQAYSYGKCYVEMEYFTCEYDHFVCIQFILRLSRNYEISVSHHNILSHMKLKEQK